MQCVEWVTCNISDVVVLGETEVADLCLVSGVIEQDVASSQIAVYEAALLQVQHPFCHLHSQLHASLACLIIWFDKQYDCSVVT